MIQKQDESGQFIDLYAIFVSLRKGWKTIAIAWVVSLLLGVLYLHITTYNYTATLLLVPTQGQNQNNIGSQLGSLSSLVGLDFLSSQNVSPFTLYPDVMKTRVVSDTFAARYPDLMHELFEDQWDSDRDVWRAPEGVMYKIVAWSKGVLGYPPRPWAPPNGGDVERVLSTRVRVDLDRKKPILTVTFSHRDPVFARRFLQALHESTDLVLRRQTLDRSTKYARYLEQELRKEQQAELRQVLTNTFSQQEVWIMMSSSDTPFAAQPVGGAVSSTRPTSPNPIIILLAMTMLGLLCGSTLAYRRFARSGVPS